jgi:hypothetical protein
MADGVFNVAKGRVNEYVNRVDANDPANSALIVVLFQVSEADGTLEDYDDLAALIAGSSTECTFTNYARKVLTDSDVTAPVPDDTNNRQDADIPDQTWTSAGGATNNTTTKILICYDPDTTAGTDSTIIPLTYHDFVITTNGNDLTATINAAGFFRAAS